MSTIQDLKNKLISEGYCEGNLSDFLSDGDIQELRNYSQGVKEIIKTEKSRYFKCRYNYQPPNNEPQNYPHQISLEDVAERDKLCKDNNLLVWQKWFESSPPPDADLVNVPSEIFYKIVKSIYPEYEYEKYDIPKGDISLFEDGHFICEHQDGKNEGRICVILAYLSDESEWNDGGGELVLESANGEKVEIKPFFGKFCMLDFTEHNIKHSVNEVKNGFKRITYINFITLRNFLKNKI